MCFAVVPLQYGNVFRSRLIISIIIITFQKKYFVLNFPFPQALSQNQRISNTRLKREVFFLNLEDGYFGCQVNDSTDYLQLFELSKLCDGHPDCFMSSDELARELKCTSKYFMFICFKNFSRN